MREELDRDLALGALYYSPRLTERGRLDYALRVGVRSDETPSALEEEADAMVDGPDGVRGLLRALLI
jgi:trehalose 6-phosphate phosphatase